MACVNSPTVVGDEVADDEVLLPLRSVEEGEAVAGVESFPVAALVARMRAEGGGGDEAGDQERFLLLVSPSPERHLADPVVEEAQHRRRPVERAVLAGEDDLGEDGLPARADGGGADEALGVVRRDAQEDLAHGVVDQRRRRTAAGSWRGDRGLVGSPDRIGVSV